MMFTIAAADAALDGNDALEQYYGLLAVLSLAGAFFGFDQAMKEAGVTADQLAVAKENARAATDTNVDINHTTVPEVSVGSPRSGKTRVGRWMSQNEYEKMIETGQVQLSQGNMSHCAKPANKNAFYKQTSKGNLYVEYDVPSDVLSSGGKSGWGIINGPDSMIDRYFAFKGLPRITEVPWAKNIKIKGFK